MCSWSHSFDQRAQMHQVDHDVARCTAFFQASGILFRVLCYASLLSVALRLSFRTTVPTSVDRALSTSDRSTGLAMPTCEQPRIFLFNETSTVDGRWPCLCELLSDQSYWVFSFGRPPWSTSDRAPAPLDHLLDDFQTWSIILSLSPRAVTPPRTAVTCPQPKST